VLLERFRHLIDLGWGRILVELDVLWLAIGGFLENGHEQLIMDKLKKNPLEKSGDGSWRNTNG